MQIKKYFPPEKIKKRLLLIFILIAVIAAVFFVFRKKEASITILETDTIKLGTVYKVLEATGIIKPEVGAIVKIGSRATGTIKSMLVRVGDSVVKNQNIAIIDNRELQSNLNEAKANLKVAETELKKVQSVYPLQIKEAEANLASVKAESDYSKLSASRTKTLVKQKLDSIDNLDSATQRSTTSSNILLARGATLMRIKGEFEQELAKAEANVLKSKASLETATIKLSYSVINSPITGVVSEVTIQEGETVVTGFAVANLITILDPSRLEMWIYVDETDVGQVTKDMKVRFKIDSAPNKSFTGVINQIYPEPETRDNIIYYRALVRLNAEDSNHLRPEMTTQCTISVEQKDNVLSIPNTALKWVDGEQLIFIKEKNGAIKKVVPSLGLTGAERSELVINETNKDDFKEGTEVAVKLILPQDANAAKKSK